MAWNLMKISMNFLFQKFQLGFAVCTSEKHMHQTFRYPQTGVVTLPQSPLWKLAVTL